MNLNLFKDIVGTDIYFLAFESFSGSFPIATGNNFLNLQKLYPASSIPITIPFKIQIPAKVFEREDLAAKQILSPTFIKKLKSAIKETPLIVEATLTLEDGTHYSKKIDIDVKHTLE